MYYQADIQYSNRLFKLFLVLSFVLHAGILLYKENRSTFLLATDNPFPIEQSIRVRLQEAIKAEPQPIVKKVVKKQVLEKKSEQPKVPPKKVTEQVQRPSTPQTKAFESVIRDYVAPHYPRLALRRGIQGQVRLTLWVKGNGILDKVFVAESSGHQSLDQSAIDAAKRWTFKDLSNDPGQLFVLSKLVVYKIN